MQNYASTEHRFIQPLCNFTNFTIIKMERESEKKKSAYRSTANIRVFIREFDAKNATAATHAELSGQFSIRTGHSLRRPNQCAIVNGVSRRST